MKPSELFEALHALIAERVPLHIWGACGVGKSQIVAQVASDLGWQFLDIRAVQLDPVDLRGLPRISADQAEWVPPKFLPTSGEGILFLDELTSAPQMTQAGCYQLVLDRRLGEYCLPDGWVVMAVAFVTMGIGVNTRTAFSLLFPPILAEFGWDRGRTAAAFSIGFLLASAVDLTARRSGPGPPRRLLVVSRSHSAGRSAELGR